MADNNPEWRPHFLEFVDLVQDRLTVGEREYGNASFTQPLPATLEEFEQELLDVLGWGFVVWRRVQRLKRGLEESRRESQREVTE